MWITLLTLLATQSSRVEHLDMALAALETPNAAVEGVRRLSRVLGPEDGPWLLARSTQARPAVQLGLIRALAAEERHLGLCAWLAIQEPSSARELGLSALRSQIQEFIPGEVDSWDSTEQWVSAMSSASRWRLAGLAGNSEEWPARCAGLLPLVLDPNWKSRSWSVERELEGETWELLLQVCQVSEARAWVTGYARGAEHARWVWLAPTGAQPTLAPRALLERWVLHSAKPDAPQRMPHLRALGMSGWPAALQWIDALAYTGDADAREAVWQLAECGAVSPYCFEASHIAELLLEMDRAPTWDRAQRLARVLIAIGPLDAQGGEALASAWEADNRGATRGQALRLSILAQVGRASAGALDFVQRMRRDSNLGLRALALEAARPLGLDEPSVSEWAELVTWANGRARRELLERCAQQWPARWPNSADPLLWPAWAMRAGAIESLCAAVERAALSPHSLAAWKETLGVSDWERLVAALEGRGLTPLNSLSQARWEAGVPPTAAALDWLEQALEADGPAPQLVLAIAHAVGEDSRALGVRARQWLLQACRSNGIQDEVLLQALPVAAQALAAQSSEQEAFAAAVRQALRESDRGTLWIQLLRARWLLPRDPAARAWERPWLELDPSLW